MFAVNLVEMRKRLARLRPSPSSRAGVWRIALALAAFPSLPGCVADSVQTADIPAALGSQNGAPMDGAGDAMVAKARALAFADPNASRPQPEPQVDLAMLAMRSNSTATHRLDGPAVPGAPSDALSPEQVLERLRQLSHDPGAMASGAEADDRSQAVLARLQELSHHPASPSVVTEIQASAGPQASGPRRPISPEDMLRRMRELSAAKPARGANAAGDEAVQRSAAAFGGLGPFVPAPDMAHAPSDGAPRDGAPRTAEGAGH